MKSSETSRDLNGYLEPLNDCFSLHVTATSEYNVHVCIYTVMYFTYGYNNDVNNYFFLLGLLYCEASAKT